jgi:hypothetical protein
MEALSGVFEMQGEFRRSCSGVVFQMTSEVVVNY